MPESDRRPDVGNVVNCHYSNPAKTFGSRLRLRTSICGSRDRRAASYTIREQKLWSDPRESNSLGRGGNPMLSQ